MTADVGNLETELLSLILTFVVDNSPSTVKSLALVNRSFYSTTKLIGHRFKKVKYGTARGEAGKGTDLEPWFEDEVLLRGVRHVTVESSRSYGHSAHHDSEKQDREALEIAKYGDLITLITKLGSLKTLTWSYNDWSNSCDPIPAKVLNTLHEHHKKAELRVTWNRWDTTADHTDPSETALAKSPALSSIQTQIGVRTFPKQADKSRKVDQAERVLWERTGLPMFQGPSMLRWSRLVRPPISRNANICAS